MIFFTLFLCNSKSVAMSVFIIVHDSEDASYKFLKRTDVVTASSRMALVVEEGLSIFQ